MTLLECSESFVWELTMNLERCAGKPRRLQTTASESSAEVCAPSEDGSWF